jgi:hypothetical protein
MGLMPEQLYDLTFREFSYKIEGFNEITELQYRNHMEAARFQSALVISAFSGKSLSPGELVRFPWENNISGRKFSKMDNKKFQKLKNAITKL